MDAILCGEGSIANADKMMSEISRVLKPNGVFLVITPGDLDQRLKYLDPDNDGGHRYEWTIQKDTMPKPRVAGAVADAGGLHYCYTCQKGKLDGEEGEEGAEGAAAAEGGAAADPAAEAPAEAS
jgi:SAM-dependent methyltransferase